MREFTVPRRANLDFWSKALRSDVVDHRGYHLTAEKRVRDGKGNEGFDSGDYGEPGSKIVQETLAKPTSLTVEVLPRLFNLFFGLNQDAEIHGKVSSACLWNIAAITSVAGRAWARPARKAAERRWSSS